MLCVPQCRIGTASVGKDRGENGTWSVLREQGPAAGGDDHSGMGSGGGGKCVRDPAGGDDDEAEVCYRGVRLYVYVSRIDDGVATRPCVCHLTSVVFIVDRIVHLGDRIATMPRAVLL